MRAQLALPRADFTRPAISLLATIGAADAQQTLAHEAERTDLPEDERQLALAAFATWPRSGEVLVELARLACGVRGNEFRAPAAAVPLALLDAAQRQTPQYGDAYVERLRVAQVYSEPGSEAAGAPVGDAAAGRSANYGETFCAAHAFPQCEERECAAGVFTGLLAASCTPVSSSGDGGGSDAGDSGRGSRAPGGGASAACCYGLLRRLYGGFPPQGT